MNIASCWDTEIENREQSRTSAATHDGCHFKYSIKKRQVCTHCEFSSCPSAVSVLSTFSTSSVATSWMLNSNSIARTRRIRHKGASRCEKLKKKPKRVTKYMRLSSVRHLRRRRGDSQTIAKSLLKMNY